MNRIITSSKSGLLFLGICVVFFIGQCVIGGELASEPNEFRIGVWSLRFTNRVNQITNADITNMVEISSSLVVTLRDGVAGVHIDGVVVNVKSGQQTTCDIIVDNHIKRYEVSCMEQQPPFATVTIRIYEDINKGVRGYYATEGGLPIATDGQLNLLPVPVDNHNKTDICRFIAIIKDQEGRPKDKDVRSTNSSGGK